MRAFASVLAFAVLAAPGTCLAGAAKDYAYVFVQGRIADPYEKHVLSGATVRLTTDSRVFEAVTDRKGVFVFERLPVATFTLDIVTEDGRLVSWFKGSDSSDPSRPRVSVKFGKKRGASTITVSPGKTEDHVEVVVKSPPAGWDKFWKEFAIFGAVAVVLAVH